MIRLFFTTSALLLSPALFAQTTLDITVPSTGLCSYTTGAVSSGSTAGHLQANATAAPSGPGCGTTGGGTSSGNVSFGPASPLTPATAAIGPTGTVNFTMQPVNATVCNGTITGANGGSFVGSSVLCSPTTTACGTLQNVSTSFSNTSSGTLNYTVTATCQDSTGHTAISTALVTSSPNQQTSSCLTVPNSAGGSGFKQFAGLQNVTFDGVTHSGTLKVDVTSHDAVYGTPFPGVVIGQTGRFTLPTADYISMKFVVPVGYGAGQSGFTQAWTVNNTGFQAPVSMTISTSCGDFSNPTTDPATSTVVNHCRKVRVLGGGKLTWQEAASANACVLQEGTTYYLNLINADITSVGPNGTGSATTYYNTPATSCSGASCSVPLQTGGPFVPQ